MYTCILALTITNGPMNVTVCSGSVTELSCDFTGAPDPFKTRPDWRIIKRNNDGNVISNETVNAAIIRINKSDGLVFHSNVLIDNSTNGRLSVGPVDDTYNNTSYQCIFTINDTIIESNTAGTITVIGMYAYRCMRRSFLCHTYFVPILIRKKTSKYSKSSVIRASSILATTLGNDCSIRVFMKILRLIRVFKWSSV